MSPLTATTIISASAGFHGICGFTGGQVKLLMRVYFNQNIDLNLNFDHIYEVMEKYYGGYLFAESPGANHAKLETLSNPRLVYHFLSELKEHGCVNNPGESPAVHTTKILKSIADTGDFSVEDIMELMATGFLMSPIVDEFGYVDLVAESGADRVTTLSLLVHLGVLTLGHTEGQVEIPNQMMKSQVYELTSFLLCQC